MLLGVCVAIVAFPCLLPESTSVAAAREVQPSAGITTSTNGKSSQNSIPEGKIISMQIFENAKDHRKLLMEEDGWTENELISDISAAYEDDGSFVDENTRLVQEFDIEEEEEQFWNGLIESTAL